VSQEALSISTTPQALAGVRVLDLSRWVAGEFCTKLFADFGADVIKVERPGVGSLTRQYGPFLDDVPNTETSALFLHLNTNKRSVTIDMATSTGRDLVLELVASAHLVVESFRPGALERLGLGPEQLHEANPNIVITRISPFGQTGPYRDYEASGLTLQASGWAMNATGAADHPPHRKPGLLEHYTVGRMAAEASMAGLTAARRFQHGSVIDLAGMETLLVGADRRASYLVTAAYSGSNAPRGVRSAHRSGATYTGPFRCKDGYVMLYVTTPAFWKRLVELVAGDDEDFRARYSDRFDLRNSDEMKEFSTRVTEWFADRPKLEAMEQGERLRVPLTAFMEIPEVLDSAHFRGRGCFVESTHPVAGSLEYLGPPWRMSAGWQLRRTAPLLGGDTQEVLSELGIAPESLRALRGQGAI
jgi:formyl-CoA transferase/CoA:oxalate CoA-transferase